MLRRWLVSIASLPLGLGAGFPDSPETLLIAYVEALGEGDTAAVGALWHPGDVARSRALGVSYEDAPVKVDCASPLLGYLEELTDGRATVAIEGTRIDSTGATIDAMLRLPDGEFLVSYHAVATEGGWRLVTAPTRLAKSWPTWESRFARVHCEDSSLVHPEGLASLDSFVVRTGTLLGLGKADLELLEDAKIEYWLGDSTVVKNLSGFDTHGLTHLGLDGVITRHLPHDHEVAHVLMNFALGDAPLYALPALQEGFAVAAGGRWEKSPRVILAIGRFLHEEDTAMIDHLFTRRGFAEDLGSADVSYPLAGLLVAWIIERYGAPEFLDLYRELSCMSGKVETFPPSRLSNYLDRLTGTEGGAWQNDFGEYVQGRPGSGIEPGIAAHPSAGVLRMEREGLSLELGATAERWVVRVRPGRAPALGSLLLTPREPPVKGYAFRSPIFARHFPGRVYERERFALRFDRLEAGLYDYYTGILLVKYVTAFDQSDKFHDPETGELRFVVDCRDVPGELADYDLELLAE